MIASVPGLADLLALQSRSADIDDDLDSVASSSVASVTKKKRASVRLSTVKSVSSYNDDNDDEGMLSDGNEDADADEEQENEKIVKAVKQAAGKGQKKGKKAAAGALPAVQTKTMMTKKSRNPTAATASSKESRLETENRNPEAVITSRRVEYI